MRRGVAKAALTASSSPTSTSYSRARFAEDLEQLADRSGEPLQLVADLVAAERGQAVEAQVEDRADLSLAQRVGVAGDRRLDRFHQRNIGRDLRDRPFACEQRGARLGGRGRAADDADDLVEVGDRDDEAEQDVGALARLEQLELGAAGDDLLAEGDEGRDDVAQAEQLGAPAADREHVGGEARLRGRVPPELVEHHVGGRVALELEHDAHALRANSSSRMSATPSIRFSLAASAIFSTSPFLPT